MPAQAIRSDVIGSLLRPPELKAARERRERGELSPTAFKQVEDRAVDDAVRLQEEAGLDVVTDGELRRYAFFGHLIDALDGFDKQGGWAIPFHNEAGERLVFKRPVVVEKLRWRRSMCGEELAYLRARATRAVKVTLISSQQAAAYYDPEKSAGAYPTRDAYLADVVDFTRREVDELVRLGGTYIQIDAPQYAALLDPELREGYRKRGSDPDRLIDVCIEMDNAVIGRHPGVTFGLHICRTTTSPCSTRAAATSRSRACSARAASSASCSSTTTSAPAASSRCARCPTTAPWCSASSPPRAPGSRRWPSCGPA